MKTKTSCLWCHGTHEIKDCNLFLTAISNGNIRAKKFQAKMVGAGRVCGFCAEPKHASTTCPVRFKKIKDSLRVQKGLADHAFAWLHQIGFGPGCMLSGMARERSYRAREKGEKILVIEEFVSRNQAQRFFENLLYGKERNWYEVTAINTSAEKVRFVYLPFHSVYAPKPASLYVQIIHRATNSDIESWKKNLLCYSHVINKFNNPEDYFNAGQKLPAGNSLFLK